MFEKLKSDNMRKLIESFLSLSVLNIVNYIFPLIIIPVLIKRLGFENYGIYIFAYTILNYFNLIVQYGFNFSATNKIAKNQNDNQLIQVTYSSVSVIRILLSVILILGLLISYIIIPDKLEIYLYGIGVFLGQGLIPIWLFQGLEKMRFITVINLIVRVLAFLLIFLFVKNPADMNKLMIFQSISFMIGAMVSIYMVRRQLSVKFVIPSMTQIKADFVEGWQLFLSTIGMNFYRESNIVILGIMTNYTIVGYYAPAEKLIKALQSFTNIIVTALYPYFSKKFVTAKEDIVRSFAKVGKYLAIFFFAIWLIFFIIAPYIIKLYLGDTIPRTVLDLRLLSCVIFFGGLNYYYGIIGLVNKGKQTEFTKSVWISGIISVICCVILSTIWEDLGAAIAMAIAEIILLIMILVKIRK